MEQITYIGGGNSKENQKLPPRVVDILSDVKDLTLKFVEGSDYKEERVSKIIGNHETEEIDILDMPNWNNADYEEGKRYFEEYISKIEGEITLVGYSLGATFFIKYLSENPEFINRIKHVYLIAGVYTRGLDRTFSVDDNAQGLGQFDSSKITVIHGDRDRTVPYRNLEDLQQDYPDLGYKTLNGVGHDLGQITEAIQEQRKKNG